MHPLKLKSNAKLDVNNGQCSIEIIEQSFILRNKTGCILARRTALEDFMKILVNYPQYFDVNDIKVFRILLKSMYELVMAQLNLKVIMEIINKKSTNCG